MSKAPQYKYACLTCKGTFTAPRKAVQARCIACGSMRTELTATLAPLRLDGTQKPQLVRPGDDQPPQVIEEAPEPRVPPKRPESEKATDITGMFACIDCARKFVWNYTKRPNIDPFCSKCKSAEVKSISPKASAIAIIKGQIPTVLTKKDVKRIRFIRHHWRMRCELKEYVGGLKDLLKRLGFKGEKINQAQNILNELLADVDRQQQLRLTAYDEVRVS